MLHLHVHLISRLAGDMDDPCGGVRHAIPGRGSYLAGEGAVLVGNRSRTVAEVVGQYLADRRFHRADPVVSFVRLSRRWSKPPPRASTSRPATCRR